MFPFGNSSDWHKAFRVNVEPIKIDYSNYDRGLDCWKTGSSVLLKANYVEILTSLCFNALAKSKENCNTIKKIGLAMIITLAKHDKYHTKVSQ